MQGFSVSREFQNCSEGDKVNGSKDLLRDKRVEKSERGSASIEHPIRSSEKAEALNVIIFIIFLPEKVAIHLMFARPEIVLIFGSCSLGTYSETSKNNRPWTTWTEDMHRLTTRSAPVKKLRH
jgi:hypothetical protein